MFEILSRFDLRADQVCSIVSEDRENVSITASIAEMKENPYIIFEQYIGYDSDDVIPFYRIDNGVIPSPEYGIDEILDCGSTERLRAFCVDELNRIAAHSFGKAKSILKTINARVERLPEWKRYVYRMKNFDIDQEIWEGALVQKKDDQGILYLYLKENYEDERTIEDALRNLADRPDITLKMAITPEKFKRGLRVEGSPLEKKTAAEYDLILEHQAEICMQIFVKPLCVLSGAEELRDTAIDLPVRGAINGWCYLVPYEGKLKSHTVKKVIGMFIPQNRNGQEKMVSVSVVKEDRIIYISKDMFKIYEQSLSEPDGIQLKRTFF